MGLETLELTISNPIGIVLRPRECICPQAGIPNKSLCRASSYLHIHSRQKIEALREICDDKFWLAPQTITHPLSLLDTCQITARHIANGRAACVLKDRYRCCLYGTTNGRQETCKRADLLLKSKRESRISASRNRDIIRTREIVNLGI